MPIFNAAKFLEESITSVLTQTWTDFELICIVNGSTDASLAICDSFAHTDARLKVLTLSQPSLVAALNYGIAAARSDWIARMDADDICEPERLETQIRFLESNPDVVALGTSVWQVGSRGNIVGLVHRPPHSRDAFNRMRERNEPIGLYHPSAMFSKGIAEQVGLYRQQYFPAEDLDLWMRMIEHGVVLNLQDPLVRYRIHTGSISSRHTVRQMEAIRFVIYNSNQRRTAQPEIARNRFREIESHLPIGKKFKNYVESRRYMLYRNGGSRLASGDVRGYLWLLASFLLNPMVTCRRVHSQKVIQIQARKRTSFFLRGQNRREVW
jgi:glycosyltransferase involved in cell wall biosynthesis